MAASDAQRPAGEPFRQLPQPGLWDAVEPQPSVALDVYPPQFPDFSGEFGLPAGPKAQVFKATVGVAQKRELPVVAVHSFSPREPACAQRLFGNKVIRIQALRRRAVGHGGRAFLSGSAHMLSNRCSFCSGRDLWCSAGRRDRPGGDRLPVQCGRLSQRPA